VRLPRAVKNNAPNLSSATPPVLDGFGTIAANYKLLLSDVWGVVHNGVAAYPAACEALKKARENGATVVLISNAPRPGVVVAKQIAKWGVPADCYDTIVASGDVARTELEARPEAKLFHLGPARDMPNYDGLPNKMVGEDECDVVVVTGPFNDEVEVAEDYRAMFEGLIERNVLMLCANPDLVVERGDKLIVCAGALAQLYEQMGGKAIYAGKPYAPIYDQVVAVAEKMRGEKITKSEMLAIGDGARTDLKGAALQGVDCLFITGGIHAEDFSEEKNRAGEVFSEQAAWPIGMMHRLSW
jgi:HAD superfamily hydrolase (TIGR01459 family)